jgi:hypothetical protein
MIQDLRKDTNCSGNILKNTNLYAIYKNTNLYAIYSGTA